MLRARRCILEMKRVAPSGSVGWALPSLVTRLGRRKVLCATHGDYESTGRSLRGRQPRVRLEALASAEVRAASLRLPLSTMPHSEPRDRIARPAG
jgi:hypothetical protein